MHIRIVTENGFIIVSKTMDEIIRKPRKRTGQLWITGQSIN
jgi:hypothetical protein